MKKWLNKFHSGDCLALMRKMPSESVDLVVTSPPYNIRNSTGNGLKDGRGGKWSSAELLNGYDSHGDAMPHDVYNSWQHECLSEMLRITKSSGAIFYNHKWRVQGGLLQDRNEIIKDLPVRQIIIWQRNGGINFNPGYFLPTYEVVYLIAKNDFKLAEGANKAGDIWRISQERGNPHPAPFPVELAQKCIESTTSEIILDPFMGSGTTAIAAESLNRSWIGIDLSNKYCRMARERMKAFRSGSPIHKQTAAKQRALEYNPV